jgi:hypothetical protein
MKQIISLMAPLLASSCMAVHSGMINSNTNISAGNFHILGPAIGTAKTNVFLGIGGLNHTALVDEARRAMCAKQPLRMGQAYANTSVDFDLRYYFGLVVRTTCTVTTDILQFVDPASGVEPMKSGALQLKTDAPPLEQMGNSTAESIFISQGQEVLFIDGHFLRRGVIYRVKPDNTTNLKVKSGSGYSSFTGITLSKIYRYDIPAITSAGLNPDGIYAAPVEDGIVTGRLLGINATLALLAQDGKLYEVDHTKLTPVVQEER